MGPRPPETALQRQLRPPRAGGLWGRRGSVRTGPSPHQAPLRRRPPPRTRHTCAPSAPLLWLITPTQRASEQFWRPDLLQRQPLTQEALQTAALLAHQPLESSDVPLPRPRLQPSTVGKLFICSWRGCLCLVGQHPSIKALLLCPCLRLLDGPWGSLPPPHPTELPRTLTSHVMLQPQCGPGHGPPWHVKGVKVVAQAGLQSEQTSQRWQPGLSVKGRKGTRLQEPHGEGRGWEHRRCLKQPGLEYAGVGFHHHQPEGMPWKVLKAPPPFPYRDASFEGNW